MMDGMMGGMCGGAMGIGLLLGLLLLVAVGYVAYRFGQLKANGAETSRSPGSRGEREDHALEIARRRYAQGEISREEFDALRRDLA